MTPSLQGTLGIDFGTSNSAVSWAEPQGLSRLIALEGEALAMPTAVFFNAEDHRTHFGRDAVRQYLNGSEGRLMRSLKSLLGSPLLQEKTEVNHQQISFQDIVATFLAELRQRAARALGSAPTRVVMGRPVHFVDDNPQRDAQAQRALHEAALAVGFEQVSFQLEPIAAALDYERRLPRESLVLVVDLGGGTSDFTVVRLGPQRIAQADRSGDVLATSGVHIGGTDFDHKLSLERVMPLLGYRHLGPQRREVPSRVFFDLSTWHLIQWLYLPRALSQAQALREDYADPRLHARLMTVLRHRAGHRLAHEVELAKIHCSQGNAGPPQVSLTPTGGRAGPSPSRPPPRSWGGEITPSPLVGRDGVGSVRPWGHSEHDADASISLSFIEAGLQASLTPADLREHLADLLSRTVACARDCVQRAGLGAGAVDAIYLTGGSSALRPFQCALQAEFPGVELVVGDLFGGVAAGLAYGRG